MMQGGTSRLLFLVTSRSCHAAVSIRCVFVSLRRFVFSISPGAVIFFSALFRAKRVLRRDLSRASVLSRPLIALARFDDSSLANANPAPSHSRRSADGAA